MMMTWRVAAGLLFASLVVLSPTWVRAQGAAIEKDPEVTAAEAAEDALVAAMAKPWTGDLDGIVRRGYLRVGVSYDPLSFTYDKGTHQGLSVDLAAEFEKHLRATLGEEARTLTVLLAPLPRDQMLDALIARPRRLADGQPDDDAGAPRSGWTSRTRPSPAWRRSSSPGPPPRRSPTLDDLAGTELHVRRSSSYFEHLEALNATRAGAGAPPFPIVEANENLEDFDLLELVDVGVIPAVVVDGFIAKLYAQIFQHLTVHTDLAINEGGEIAWALRKGSPQLMAAVNGFMDQARKGTLIGNIVYNRWIADADRVRNAIEPGEDAKFTETIGFIAEHAAAYAFDPILIAAQGYQEFAARPVQAQPGRRRRHHAGDAGDRQRPERRHPRHRDRRPQRRGRGEVSPLPARPVFQ